MQKVDLDAKKINESKNCNDLKRKFRIKNSYKLFCKLVVLLKNFAGTNLTYDIDTTDAMFSITKFMSTLIQNDLYEEANGVLKKLISTKSYLEEIKGDLEKDSPAYNNIDLLLQEINNLEVQALYNDRKASETVNLNLVNNIVFVEKNISISKYLLEKYPFLIDDYNKFSDTSFIEQVVDKYLDNIRSYVYEKDKKDLYYYDNLLEALMRSRSNNIVTSAMERKVLKFLNQLDLDVKQKEKSYLWINHLYNRITNIAYNPNMDTLNHLYGIRYYFKKSILDEGNIYGLNNTQEIRKAVTFPTDRKIVTDYVITIDEAGTYDRDDAISIKKINDDLYRLSVHIADPNSFCPMDSLIMLEARKRTESIYLEDTIINMFPEEIIRNSLSLDQNKLRFARTYTYDIDKYGNVVDFNIDKSLIRVNNSLSYDRVNEVLKEGTENPKLETTLKDSKEVFNILNKYFATNKIRVKNKEFTSETLVQIIMVFNNFMIAKYFSDKNLPFIYRCHQLNIDLNEYKTELDDLDPRKRKKYLELIKRMEKITLPAEYSDEVINHDSMDLKMYSTCTSPVRRYADIIANECEDKFIFSDISDEDAYAFEYKLKGDIEHLNRRAKEISAYYEKYTRMRK